MILLYFTGNGIQIDAQGRQRPRIGLRPTIDITHEFFALQDTVIVNGVIEKLFSGQRTARHTGGVVIGWNVRWLQVRGHGWSSATDTAAATLAGSGWRSISTILSKQLAFELMRGKRVVWILLLIVTGFTSSSPWRRSMPGQVLFA